VYLIAKSSALYQLASTRAVRARRLFSNQMGAMPIWLLKRRYGRASLVLSGRASLSVYFGATQTFLLAENQWGDTSSLSAKILVYDESTVDADGTPPKMYKYELDKFKELSAPEGLAFVPDDRCESAPRGMWSLWSLGRFHGGSWRLHARDTLATHTGFRCHGMRTSGIQSSRPLVEGSLCLTPSRSAARETAFEMATGCNDALLAYISRALLSPPCGYSALSARRYSQPSLSLQYKRL
jgi:hypothetical protein